MGEIISDRLDQEWFRENKTFWNLTSENAESYLLHVKLTTGAKLYVGKVNGMSREQMQSNLSGTFPVYQAASHLTLCTQSNNRALTEQLLCAKLCFGPFVWTLNLYNNFTMYALLVIPFYRLEN